ncbi:hypothetical protein [uncultured Mucilaginibacter sp.]|uniref:hypothetical protein n=1 Tax=uncultured Mucilaginibacter sp. TaxID=797541 RepID=UPI0025D8547D|nr:hypothetical protein [uncultured Mucilaginibacter sp.]
MKRCLLCLLLMQVMCFCHAQDTTTHAEPETVTRTNKPFEKIIEKFSVLKADKKTKQGLFQAFFNDAILVASGKYEDGKKMGKWRYNNTQGTLDQVYDYTNRKLIYVTAPDTAWFKFDFDTKINDTDKLTYPIKIGGAFYGYQFVYNETVVPFSQDMHDSHLPGKFRCTNILSVSPDGMLTRWQLLATNGNFKKLYEVPMDKLSDDDKLFVAATQNGKPIPAKVYVDIYMQVYF